MNLHSALKTIVPDSTSTPDIHIPGIQFHSGKVKQGDLFVAIPGKNLDGHTYIKEAIKAGAAAVVGEMHMSDLEVPYFRVSNARLALAQIASLFYNHPSRRHIMVGITGTNGKTTTAHMLRHILETAGVSCTLIGSVCQQINGEEIQSTQTTPDALQLQQWLDYSHDQVVIMEVSSHGIDQERIGAIGYDFTVFTNLTHDHLDYHHTLEEYFETKARLFKQMKSYGEAIVSSGCEWGKRLSDQLLTEGSPVHTFGEATLDQLQITRVISASPLEFDIQNGQENYTVSLPLSGVYNAWNASAAWLTARRMGVNPLTIQKALETFPGVPGRFEMYKHPRGAECIIDYAHTPDGLLQFLKTVRGLTDQRIIHIFGFRGNGDQSKRQPMFDISTGLSDLIILTLDDLKGAIADELLTELREMASPYGLDTCVVIEDRTKAIEFAWELARSGDIVVITGKGTEAYDQSFALPCTSDRETIKYLIRT
ncbi:UDP-N-acetylmuramoyl-L-alanyl-D-glutamate--2,6-diaminopimelate ligase [Paenibacillus sp. BR2-3]|uniref:UDP-N-acetylmuramoyl-L-alanyl-D-glutamate--2, 6-diaminopimelate ligase n=1 Tax=Paenibacillus sp. BR2-3 TaxID=3048494 RepID=UPI00397783C7